MFKNKKLIYTMLNGLLLPFTIIWLELILAIKSCFDFSIYKSIGVVLIGFGAGLFLDLLCSLTPFENLNRWLYFALSEILSIFFLIEFFAADAYSSFMSIGSIITGAGGVVTGFGDVVLSVIAQGIDVILLFHVPSIIILILCITKSLKMVYSCQNLLISVAIAIGFMVFGSYFMTDTEFYKNKYTYDYVFDDAVRTFGVTKSVALDIKYAISGIPIKEINPVDDIDEDPKPTEYAEHKLNIDWEGFWNSIGNNSGLNNAASVVTSTKASQENEYTGLFEGKNLVLITVESFSKELIRQDFFPLIYKMANEGIVVEDYYHPFWGGSTTSGESAILTGLIPTEGAKTLQNTLGKNNNYTLAPMLSARQNYACIAYHNGDYDYYSRYKTHPSLGFSAFYSYGSGMEDWLTDTWPRGDLEMFQFIKEDVKNYDSFYAYIMTFSGHGLYNFSGNEIGKKNRDLLKGTEYYNDKRIGGYIACSMDLELGLEDFVASLEERGILEDTVFVLTTDHYAYALQNGDAWLNDRNYLEDLFGYYPDTQIKRDHNALIIWSPCLSELDEPIIVSDPCSAIDILPTLLNLFGLEYDSRLYAGRDILSDEDPLVIWANSSWLTDKGSYDSTTGVFTPKEGVEIPDNYVQTISDKVRNKMTLSRNFISNDFYKYIEANIN